MAFAAAVGLTLVLQYGGTPACAAPPGSSSRSGEASFYDLGGGQGNCSFPNAPADDLFVALGDSEYSQADACGTYLDVTGPKGSVRVKVIDRCPECERGHLDLSRTAFARIADTQQGIVPITYRAAAAPVAPGPITVRVKEGSSQFFLAVLIDNHATELDTVRIAGPGESPRSAKRADFNFWIIESGIGPGPFRITMTDVGGRQATATDIRLLPERTQVTDVRLGSGSRAAAPAPTRSAARRAAATPSPTPTASVAVRASSSSSPPRPPRATAVAVDAIPPSRAAAPPPADATEVPVALAGSNTFCN